MEFDLKPVEIGGKGKGMATTISLPVGELQGLLDFYRIEGNTTKINIPVVVIYNIRQLAEAIAKELKNCSGDGC